jgi:hypothetical protein
MNKHASKGAEPCNAKRKETISDIAIAVLGVGFLSPWIIGYRDETNASWDAWWGGFLVATLALSGLAAYAEWKAWASFGDLDRAGALAPGIPFKRERVVSPSHHRVRGPFRSSPGDHFTLRYEQKADARRRNRRKGGGVSEQCRRRGLNILCEVSRGAADFTAPLFAHTVG